ncbi:CoB--CoM heterodisulfide reductase iron-sulfur subunit B family protein [bacterium]|nr:CoB--CoM heterodisulfide reductase iron-sulfur subunit B family protein [bacterium]
MKIGYYPGCTLKTKAKNLEISTIEAMKKLDVEMVELDRWNCCGAVYSLADDDLVHLLAPVRDLIRARDAGLTPLMTLCSMCYNTLARANLLMRNDEVKREAINNFMEEEENYQGEVEVVHLLNFLRDSIGWDKVKAAVENPLDGIKLAPYYGCTLTRPLDVSVDHNTYHNVFGDMMKALGGEVVDFQEAETCCGSYQVISNPDAAEKTTVRIIESALKAGADALVLSCPLCDYNLGKKQADLMASREGIQPLPVVYMSQLMALAFGVPAEMAHFELNPPLTREFLEARGLLARV